MTQLTRYAQVSLAVLLLSLARPSAGLAQGTARSMDIDLSIRSAGMAGASNAVFWGGSLNHWANPAVLGYTRGIRYEYGKTQLVPGLATDVFIRSEAVKVGWGGIGLVAQGKHGGVGGVLLDYGESEGVDESGNPIGTFHSQETVDSWGFGVSALQTLEAVARAAGLRPPPVSRYFDVSGGMNFKDVEVQLAPPSALGVGSTRARDAGVLARLTLLDGLERNRTLPARFEVAYGNSKLSYNDDASITFGFEETERVSRHRREGFALHAAVNAPVMVDLMRRPSPIGSLARGFSPLLSIGAAFDHDRIDAGAGTSEYRVEGSGYEATFANVFALRRGHYEDKVGDVVGRTWGWMVALPLGDLAGARYEFAQVPQARNSDLPDVKRHAWSAWIDPVAIWRAARSAEHGRLAQAVR